MPFGVLNTDRLYWVIPLATPDAVFEQMVASPEAFRSPYSQTAMSTDEFDRTIANITNFLYSDEIDDRSDYPSAAILFPLAELLDLRVLLWSLQTRQSLRCSHEQFAFLLDSLVGEAFW